jgi:enoyl-CoA hydratase
MSAYEGWTLSLDQALRNEFGRGLPSIESDEMRAGIARFTSGAGRHGTF